LFVLGGQDDENNKLDDLWQFNITTKTWTQINYNKTDDTNVGRSGHAAVGYGSKMYVFGGILEVTKELNDLLAYNYQT
jgi:N-acetylneuraminic acid mutarotase